MSKKLIPATNHLRVVFLGLKGWYAAQHRYTFGAAHIRIAEKHRLGRGPFGKTGFYTVVVLISDKFAAEFSASTPPVVRENPPPMGPNTFIHHWFWGGGQSVAIFPSICGVKDPILEAWRGVQKIQVFGSVCFSSLHGRSSYTWGRAHSATEPCKKPRVCHEHTQTCQQTRSTMKGTMWVQNENHLGLLGQLKHFPSRLRIWSPSWMSLELRFRCPPTPPKSPEELAELENGSTIGSGHLPESKSRIGHKNKGNHVLLTHFWPTFREVPGAYFWTFFELF